MQSVSLTCHTDRTELNFEGALDASRAQAVYETLNEALMRALPLELHTAEVERIDGAGLQLFVAFQRGAQVRGLAVHWRSIGEAVRSGAESLGLTQTLELPA
jgi:ABC-type transporter Mla MlaB component